MIWLFFFNLYVGPNSSLFCIILFFSIYILASLFCIYFGFKLYTTLLYLWSLLHTWITQIMKCFNEDMNTSCVKLILHYNTRQQCVQDWALVIWHKMAELWVNVNLVKLILRNLKYQPCYILLHIMSDHRHLIWKFPFILNNFIQ